MRLTLDQKTLFREAEAARMARQFGDTPLGPVFFTDAGAAIPVTAEERALFLTQAQRAIDAQARQQARAGFEAVGIALLLIFAFQTARGLLGPRVPALATLPVPLAALPALLWPLIGARFYSGKLARLRRDLAEKLQFRTAMPAAVALPHRRYNLFKIASLLVCGVAVACFLSGAFAGQGDNGAQRFVLLMPLAWLLHFAARRVDRVHRRRPEVLERLRERQTKCPE